MTLHIWPQYTDLSLDCSVWCSLQHNQDITIVKNLEGPSLKRGLMWIQIPTS